MTHDEAKTLKSGDLVKGSNGRVYTVSHVTDEPSSHVHIWLRETGNYLIPSQAERFGMQDGRQGNWRGRDRI